MRSDIAEKLLSISKNLLAETDVNRILKFAMDRLVELSSAERGIILLYDERGQQYFQTARNFEKEDINHPEYEVSYSIIEKVKKICKPVYYENLDCEEEFKNSNSILRLNVLSVICIPLKYKNQLFGIIYLDNRKSQGKFSIDTNDVITSFADYLSFAAYRALERIKWRKTNEKLESELRTRFNFTSIIGNSPKMLEVMDMISKVADTSVTVLIEGESGTGKEIIANTIHYNSERRNEPMLTVNCAALPDNLLESEFFGHEKGAFTGAYKQQKGKFEIADGGTLFLDEIDEMSPSLQSKLLRVIQFGEYTPLGSQFTKKCDVRIIAASKSGLKNLVDNGKFRDDLYYRLNLFSIKLPPLRARGEDKIVLAEYFLNKAANALNKDLPRFSKETKLYIMNYNFPGNVRELENMVLRAVLLTRDGVIQPDDLPEEMRNEIINSRNNNLLNSMKFKEAKDKIMTDFERDYIINVLNQCNGNISKAAEKAGMHKKNFYDKMTKYNIHPQKISR